MLDRSDNVIQLPVSRDRLDDEGVCCTTEDRQPFNVPEDAAQRLSNAKGNLAANGGKGRPGFASRLVLPAAAAAAAGAPPTVELFCRPQGSVYVYAKNATTGDFGLTQIDEWHGAGHPLAW